MNITNVTITKNATSKTEKGKYEIEYSILNGELARITATVYKPDKNENENGDYVGHISSEGGTISCSLLSDNEIYLHLKEFEGFVRQIQIDSEIEE